MESEAATERHYRLPGGPRKGFLAVAVGREEIMAYLAGLRRRGGGGEAD